MLTLRRVGLLLLLIFSTRPGASLALGPENVFLVINQSVPESRQIAEYYCEKRGIPTGQILALELPTGEDISRADYDTRLASPVRDWLKEHREQAKVLLTIYGVPLRVGGQQPNDAERAQIEEKRQALEPLEAQQKTLQESIKALEETQKSDPQETTADELKARQAELRQLEEQIRPLQRTIRQLSYAESHAAVDSELALLWQPEYDLRRFTPNPLYFRFPAEARQQAAPLLMTCRLDGPSVDIVKRMIDDSLKAEATGLQGDVHVDARGIKYNPAEGGFGYGGYDQSMRDMAQLLQDAGLSVQLDDKPELWAPHSCKACALYCGWYSVANFVDCCDFVPGAVAWHLASFEAVTLRDPNTKGWCKNQLERGAAATLGPVAEPYTIGFPKPAEFFGTLVTGEFTLVETYWRTEMFASWMTVLVGDPLYNPYGKTPKLKSDQVGPSPADSGLPFERRRR